MQLRMQYSLSIKIIFRLRFLYSYSCFVNFVTCEKENKKQILSTLRIFILRRHKKALTIIIFDLLLSIAINNGFDLLCTSSEYSDGLISPNSSTVLVEEKVEKLVEVQ